MDHSAWPGTISVTAACEWRCHRKPQSNKGEANWSESSHTHAGGRAEYLCCAVQHDMTCNMSLCLQSPYSKAQLRNREVCTSFIKCNVCRERARSRRARFWYGTSSPERVSHPRSCGYHWVCSCPQPSLSACAGLHKKPPHSSHASAFPPATAACVGHTM